MILHLFVRVRAGLILYERCWLSLGSGCALTNPSGLQVHVLRGQYVGLPVEHQGAHVQ